MTAEQRDSEPRTGAVSGPFGDEERGSWLRRFPLCAAGTGQGWEEAGPPALAALLVPLPGVGVVETGKQFSQITPGSKWDSSRRSFDSS